MSNRTWRQTLVIGCPLLALMAASIISLPVSASGTTEKANGFTVDEKYLEALEWDAIGPPRGGRATACTGVIGDPMTYYMGATGGGVWKTTNAGNTWQPLGDDTFKTGSVGSIAIAQSDSNVIYVGMGERCPRGNFSHGDGVYKSLDAGKTWTNIGLKDTQTIGKVLVHPKDENLVYVAALGHIHGPNKERGLFRSNDGGETWENILFVDENTGAIDLAMNPSNPREMYVGFWEVSRTPWTLDSGGSGSGLYKTTDGGDTWEELTKGLPKGIMGKIGITVSPVNPDRVWAIIEAKEGGVYRSDDAGESWTRTSSDASLRQRAWYYTHIYADTQSADRVYVLNVGFHRSDDGGKTFETRIRVPHGDNHDLWINPDNAMNMVEANDGGANVSFDAGKSWTRQDMLPTAQFYHVTVDDQFPYRVYG
ncbi:MAG: glycosyl hydrolase, partial [Planctomycetota bacterium]|nr:glycosyl hydrolase [Planctomycetota bacterium]